MTDNAKLILTSTLALLLAGCPAPPATPTPGTAPGTTGSPAQPPAERPRLGLRAGPAGPDAPEPGVVIREVYPDSPAETAGLQAGDLVVAVSGQPTATPGQLATACEANESTPARPLRFEILRSDERMTLEVQPPASAAGSSAASLSDRSRRSLARAADALIAQQDAAGLWPHFHGTAGRPASLSVSALALRALSALPPDLRQQRRQAILLTTRTLVSRIQADGSIRDEDTAVGLRAYASALLLTALVELRAEAFPDAIERLRSMLLRSQLRDANGYPTFDWHHGSWNYYEGGTLDTTRADMSLHSFVVEALAATGLAPDHAAMRRARRFVERSQNLIPEGLDHLFGARARHPAARDGGLAFSPRDSKAGFIEIPLADSGEDRILRSYGSATADGLRTLLRTGDHPDAPRARAAHGWLTSQPSLLVNGGFPDDQPIPWSRGIHFYYLHSLTDALSLWTAALPEDQGRAPAWAHSLANALLAAQRTDGSFASSEPLMGEDNPTVATSLALLSLSRLMPLLP